MLAITDTTYSFVYAALGGIVPALFWLWFWLREDKLHPEPRGRIMLAFLGGMAAVALVYFPEKWIIERYGLGATTLWLWAALEESMKLFMAWLTALRTRDNDEPIDAIEYLITTALGFAALENTFFILNPLLDGHILQGLIATNMRFVGASLLHVVSSGVLGYFIAREFYRGRLAKNAWRIVGLSVAIALHALFNLFIIYDNGSETFLVFGCVWAAAIGVLLLFERAKAVHQ
ncbi:MAG: PrsW family intramembrane metalloprotease [Patescibacteria group bacterium]|nr:PrsW family intramembrane metalloprotease [Patescibacteria group bacterium]MDE2116344.1 PrsW family intramembrane metalloprotease [Patescibacteria group bacterium]